ARRAHLPGDGSRAARCPQPGERAGGDRLRAVDGDGARGHPAGHRRVSRRRPPDRARPRGRRRRVLQRLQGHQRRLHHQGARELHGARGVDRGRQGEGPGFRAPHPGGARARAPRRPDRRGPGAAPRSPGAGGRRRRGRRVHGGGGAGGARGGPAGRRRAAVARLRLLRHVRQLRAPRRRLQGRGHAVGRLMPRKLTPDLWLFAVVVVLVSVGVVMVYSASAIVAAERFHDPFFFLRKQLFWAVAGFGGLWMAMRLDYRRLERVVTPLLVVSFALLVLVLVPPFGQE